MRDGTAEPVSRDKILRHARAQGDINFPCSADHEQDWQPYPVDPYSTIICGDYTYIQTYTQTQQQIELYPSLSCLWHFKEKHVVFWCPSMVINLNGQSNAMKRLYF